jgi:outer membrane lipoprotein-sorting protein
MKVLITRITPLIILLSFILSDASSQDPMAVLNKMDEVMFSPKDRQGKIVIILTDKTGKEKVREAEMFEKGPERKLYRYTKPESQAGMATLTLPGSVMWVYLPALGNPKKVSILSKDQSFNNTDFSYEDMAQTPYADRYTPEFINSEGDAHILSMVPKSGTSNYSRVIVTINKTYGYPITMEYYNQLGKKFKEASYKYERIGKYWNASEVVMKDLEKDHSTKILLTDIRFDQGIPDDLFRVENLKPLKTGQ